MFISGSDYFYQLNEKQIQFNENQSWPIIMAVYGADFSCMHG
jgi:hypothetical protein